MFTPNLDIKSLIIGILLTAIFFILIGAKPVQPTVTEYKVNSFQEEENLEKWANEQIKKGWQPTGGVTISYIKYSNGEWGLYQAQAMVK